MIAKVAVTGAAGFVGSHLVSALRRADGVEPIVVPREAMADAGTLAAALRGADAVVHLAGQNRGPDQEVFDTNAGLASVLSAALERLASGPALLFASSSQRETDSAYGRSKKRAEEILAAAARGKGRSLGILVIPNVFGPGCRPFYNSAVATFCHQLARREEPSIVVDKTLELIHVADLVMGIVRLAGRPQPGVREHRLRPTYRRSVSAVLGRLAGFEETIRRGETPSLGSRFDRLLFSTLLWYHEPRDLEASPQLHTDARGTLFEILRSSRGQVFFSTTEPGVVRGNHYHTRKLEKFCVVTGDAVIRLRPVQGTAVREVRVSGERPAVVDIPVYHAHHLENVGQRPLMTLFWASEPFDPQDPDTYFEEV